MHDNSETFELVFAQTSRTEAAEYFDGGTAGVANLSALIRDRVLLTGSVVWLASVSVPEIYGPEQVEE
jgi:hypothetical protein